MTKDDRIYELVHSGEYQGIKFYIMKYGFKTEEFDYHWYCGYVEPPKDKLTLNISELEVHGGITFDGYRQDMSKNRIWGWDYNHCEDIDYENKLKNKFQFKSKEEVVNIISKDCQEFIRRYLV